MFTRRDLRELAVLTAMGVVVGLVHLGLRPDLPVVAEPVAACTLDGALEPLEPPAPPEPAASMESLPMTPASPGAAP